jgi:hypothetical protein
MKLRVRLGQLGSQEFRFWNFPTGVWRFFPCFTVPGPFRPNRTAPLMPPNKINIARCCSFVKETTRLKRGNGVRQMSSSAPKGQNRIAQGRTMRRPGDNVPNGPHALKGRHHETDDLKTGGRILSCVRARRDNLQPAGRSLLRRPDIVAAVPSPAEGWFHPSQFILFTRRTASSLTRWHIYRTAIQKPTQA